MSIFRSGKSCSDWLLVPVICPPPNFYGSPWPPTPLDVIQYGALPTPTVSPRGLPPFCSVRGCVEGQSRDLFSSSFTTEAASSKTTSYSMGGGEFEKPKLRELAGSTGSLTNRRSGSLTEVASVDGSGHEDQKATSQLLANPLM